jgi:ABC-2 type transport system permease protein
MFLSVALKTRESAKNIIVVIVTMVGSLFAGMFGGMKIFFDELLPFVNKISPVGLITDGFYSLLYYDDMGRYVINILSLLAVAAVFFVLSVRSLRRQRYDSI